MVAHRRDRILGAVHCLCIWNRGGFLSHARRRFGSHEASANRPAPATDSAGRCYIRTARGRPASRTIAVHRRDLPACPFGGAAVNMSDQENLVSLALAVAIVKAATGFSQGPAQRTLINICGTGDVRTQWTKHASGEQPAIHRSVWIGAEIDWRNFRIVKADGNGMQGVDFSEEDLKAWAALQKRSQPKRHLGPQRRGRRPGADWAVVLDLLRLEVSRRGMIGPKNDADWRIKADVERWVSEIVEARNETAAESTVRNRVTDMLKTIEAGN